MALYVGLCLLVFSATYGLFGEAAMMEAAPKNVQDATIARLAKLEAKLETVLEKNAELEQRIEVLEQENKHLKDLAIVVTDTTADVNDIDNKEVNKEVKERKHVRSGIQQRSAKVHTRRDTSQRMLLSGEATVGFTATFSQHTVSHLGPGQTIVFDHVISNIGNAYSNVTGIFTAPISGVYVFNYGFMVEPGDSEYVDLMLNGQRVLQNYASAAGDSHANSNSRTLVLQVDQGVPVWINHETGTGSVHGYHHSSFAGWLIALTE